MDKTRIIRTAEGRKLMALDFPASPTDGQIYNNWIYSTAKSAWKAKPLTAIKTVTSDTPPESPSNGDQWFNTLDGTLYIYVTDIDSSQWVESRAPITADGYTSPNYIINGGFDIWQRGTSFPARTATASYQADRWLDQRNGSGATVNITQDPLPAGQFSSAYCLKFSQTVAGSGGTYSQLNQLVEDVRQLAGKTVTTSFWVKAEAATTISVEYAQGFGSGGSASVYLGTASQPVTTSWTRVSFTSTLASVAGKTIGAGDSTRVGLSLPNNVVQNLYFWGVQTELASIATPFRRNANSIQGELAACQRYYVRLSGGSAYSRYGVGSCVNTTSADFVIPLPVQMRLNPSSIESSNMAIDTGAASFSGGSFITVDNAAAYGSATVRYNHTSAALTQFRPMFIQNNNSTAGYIGFSAEL
jgi:hypothetical protein